MRQTKGTPPRSKDEDDGWIFFQAQVIFCLLCAADRHAKNFSWFLRPGGRYQPTPPYDAGQRPVRATHLSRGGSDSRCAAARPPPRAHAPGRPRVAAAGRGRASSAAQSKRSFSTGGSPCGSAWPGRRHRARATRGRQLPRWWPAMRPDGATRMRRSASPMHASAAGEAGPRSAASGSRPPPSASNTGSAISSSASSSCASVRLVTNRRQPGKDESRAKPAASAASGHALRTAPGLGHRGSGAVRRGREIDDGTERKLRSWELLWTTQAGIACVTPRHPAAAQRAQGLEHENGGVTSGHTGKPTLPSTDTPQAFVPAPASGPRKAAKGRPEGMSAAARTWSSPTGAAGDARPPKHCLQASLSIAQPPPLQDA